MARMGKASITQVKSITQKVGGGVKRDSINRNTLVKKVTAKTAPARNAYSKMVRKEVPLAPYKDTQLRKGMVKAQISMMKPKKK